MKSLSDKIDDYFEVELLYTMADVQGDVRNILRQFIKELKEVMANKKVLAKEIMQKPHIMYDLMIEEIDKLAGKDLR